MADAAAVHPCRFRWDIFNPFVPWRRMEATFYHKSPTLSRWRVTLVPRRRLINNWVFQFSLRSDEGDDIIVTDRVAVNISIDGRNMHNKVEIDYYFSRTNWHEYQFDADVHTRPLMEGPHRLAIKIEIFFPSRNIENQGNGFVFDDDDLEELSEDLELLCTHPHYSDLMLKSMNPPRNYSVHSYIMQARWSDFFKVHPVHTIINNTIEINITSFLLGEVLIYLYSGTVNTSGSNWENPHYMTELFQVIDRYGLHHLYKVLARDESRQVRTTRTHLINNTNNFRLFDIDGQQLNNPSYEWHVNPNSAYEFTFRIQFFWIEANLHFLYSLHSRSPLRIYAKVKLEFVKMFVGAQLIDGVASSVHERDYTIGSNESVESGHCHFEGNSCDLNDLIKGKRRSRRGIRSVYFIRCVLNLSDGTTVIQVESEGDIGLQDERERFRVLSDHMYESMIRPRNPDLDVVCRAERPSNPRIPNEFYHLHKSIFTIRIPRWTLLPAVLENVIEGDDIPEILTFNMKSEAFFAVLSYLYTGKAFPVPIHYLDEIDNFAEQVGWESLRELVERMRLAAHNI